MVFNSRVETDKRDFTTQHVLFPFSAVGCGAHTREVQGVAQHGVHLTEDARVDAGGQGRVVAVRTLQPAGVVSLQWGGGKKAIYVLIELYVYGKKSNGKSRRRRVVGLFEYRGRKWR